MQESETMHWTIELNQKIFHIYVNRNNETVTVKGTVEDLDEKVQVEKYMRIKSPSTYQIFSEVKIEK